MNREQIISGFNQLRQAQKALSSKIIELENDLNEHNLVISTLKTKEEDRKCFRLIGGILVERSIKEVLPSLMQNRDLIANHIETFKQKLVEKGEEINAYIDKHNIQIRQASWSEPKKETKEESVVEIEQRPASGVLIPENPTSI